VGETGRAPGFTAGGPRLAPAALVPRVLRFYAAFNRAPLDTLLPEAEELVARLDSTPGPLLRAGDAARPAAWLHHAIEHLRATCDQAHSLTRLAECAGVHPVYFARVFRRWTGMSVGEYLRRCRVDRAVSALAKNEAGAAALAQRLGFSDQSHFTRAFRRETGTTPAAFRRSTTALPRQMPAARDAPVGRFRTY